MSEPTPPPEPVRDTGKPSIRYNGTDNNQDEQPEDTSSSPPEPKKDKGRQGVSFNGLHSDYVIHEDELEGGSPSSGHSQTPDAFSIATGATTPASEMADTLKPLPTTYYRRLSRNDGDGYNKFAPAHIYYSPDAPQHKPSKRTWTFSGRDRPNRTLSLHGAEGPMALRRGSHDESTLGGQKFLINVERTKELLLRQEDSDDNVQITIEDHGPKVITLGTASSHGFVKKQVRGTYMLSNLLQELTLAQAFGMSRIVLDEGRLNENPVDRLKRLIIDMFWDRLTRRLDEDLIEKAATDKKDWTVEKQPRIYIPRARPDQYEYYVQCSEANPQWNLDVRYLPPGPITSDVLKELNTAPGILALETETFLCEETGRQRLRGIPFVVPGARFNEMYGWDSYMESLGLLESGRADLAKAMVINFCYQIEHYGKILNANRSYYLMRSQPPFLTDMALRVYEKIQHEPGARQFLRMATYAAIKEYRSIWMAEPRFDPKTGLSRYRPGGHGVPPETEPGHFIHKCEKYFDKYDLTYEEFIVEYNEGRIHEPELDEYFMHDRAVRESGHDTTYRFEGCCANLATVDLNALLYKYECDISRILRVHFDDKLKIPDEFLTPGIESGHIETSAWWDRQAKRRRSAMNKLMWNEDNGFFYDYDTVNECIKPYESATTFWAMWAGMCNPRQAEVMIKKALPKLEAIGGLLSGTRESRGVTSVERPNRQWDYPYGWAPQQMLAWSGLVRYGYTEIAERLAYKWLFMMTKAFVDFNGIVVEKYDVTRGIDPHKVDAEYGNQGSDFQGVATEGFGWVNASFIYGLTLLNTHMVRALSVLTPYETLQKATNHNESEE